MSLKKDIRHLVARRKAQQLVEQLRKTDEATVDFWAPNWIFTGEKPYGYDAQGAALYDPGKSRAAKLERLRSAVEHYLSVNGIDQHVVTLKEVEEEVVELKATRL